MTKIFLVDDEPLVLIGMQGMLNWAELGYTVVGTARNGAEALKAIGETYPDIVVSDIRMPVMDGFTLAESCHKDGSALPVFIMLTSYEEFDYVKRSMRLGVVDYLVKIDLTAESLTAALDKARAAVEKERRLQAPAAPAVSMDSYRDRLFLQLYGGLLTDRAAFDRQCAELGLDFHAPQYVVALGSIRTPELSTEQLLTLSTGVTRMAAETLPMLLNIMNNGLAEACVRDGFIRRSLACYKGYLTHEETSGIQGKPWIRPEDILGIADRQLDPAPPATTTRSTNFIKL